MFTEKTVRLPCPLTEKARELYQIFGGSDVFFFLFLSNRLLSFLFLSLYPSIFLACRYQEIMQQRMSKPEYATVFGPVVDNLVVPNQPHKIMDQYSEMFSRYAVIAIFNDTRSSLNPFYFVTSIYMHFGHIPNKLRYSKHKHTHEHVTYYIDTICYLA